MTRFLAAPIAAATVLLAGCASIHDMPEERLGSATLQKADGTPAGTAQLVARGDDVWVTVAATGIEPGPHGFHLHTTGACRAPDFTSAGGHLNPTNADHGTLDPNGPHLGDLPNLDISSNRTGTMTAELMGSRSQIEDWIFDSDGTAVVIHAGADDYRTDPAGDAGSRVACGVIRRS